MVGQLDSDNHNGFIDYLVDASKSFLQCSAQIQSSLEERTARHSKAQLFPLIIADENQKTSHSSDLQSHHSNPSSILS